MGFPGGTTCQCRSKWSRFYTWIRISWSRKWHPIPVFLLGKFHGQRNLGGYNPCDPKESDMMGQQWHSLFKASLMAQWVKNLPAMQHAHTQEMWVWSLGRDDPLEEEMATHSSILAGTILWTEKPGNYWALTHTERSILHFLWSHGIKNGFKYMVSLDKVLIQITGQNVNRCINSSKASKLELEKTWAIAHTCLVTIE